MVVFKVKEIKINFLKMAFPIFWLRRKVEKNKFFFDSSSLRCVNSVIWGLCETPWAIFQTESSKFKITFVKRFPLNFKTYVYFQENTIVLFWIHNI